MLGECFGPAEQGLDTGFPCDTAEDLVSGDPPQGMGGPRGSPTRRASRLNWRFSATPRGGSTRESTRATGHKTSSRVSSSVGIWFASAGGTWGHATRGGAPVKQLPEQLPTRLGVRYPYVAEQDAEEIETFLNVTARRNCSAAPACRSRA